ncbi:shufflon system plasmid conjugative transfer pilus tip adhesin PilV [Mangrovibacter plantisponsor]|uniref:Shufflon protein n=1 Tax=Mangrovibacter plantisponsor TaxID=451513 RepID=A0A317Q4Z1_9ENTR|nr:shufflon system plasmid conjugative transfer pilus tip adhesin PilV [Mangrovibacter plantisponsor]PWW10116.1 shufflon protein [Mangrovibacter plantisponsor]
MKKQNKKGFSLLELILVLGVGSMMAFMRFQDMKNEQETVIAKAVGQQIKQIGEAVNGYINIRYDKLSTLTSSSSQSSDPGPRTCNSSGCEITYQTLINEGLLPASYTGVNAHKSSYKILLKRSGITPNYVVNGLITTTLPWSEGGKFRYDLLGKAMQEAGIDSGMTQSATVVSGLQGAWKETSTYYSNISSAGLMAYRVGYDSAMYSVYLRRDGTLPMTGDLNMGGKNIKNAVNITASGAATAATLKSTGATTVGSTLTVGGASTFAGAMQVNNTISSTGNITAGGQFIGHNGGGDAYVIGGGDGNDYEFRLGSNKPLTLWRSGGSSSESRFQIWGKQSNNGDLIVSSGSDGNSTGSIVASGNITSSETITGKYLYPAMTSSEGGSCTTNGLISKNSAGSTLSCQSGIWKANNPQYMKVGGVFTIYPGTTKDLGRFKLCINTYRIDGQEMALTQLIPTDNPDSNGNMNWRAHNGTQYSSYYMGIHCFI